MEDYGVRANLFELFVKSKNYKNKGKNDACCMIY